MPQIEPLRVYARCRPLNQTQLSNGNGRKSIEIVDEKALCINSNSQAKEHIFQFQRIFSQNIQNNEVFHQAVIPLIDNVFNGINSTIFAYGITGSGKSHTMFGQTKLNNPGIIPLAFQYILKELQESNSMKIKFSYIQIYNEQVFDLFSSNHNSLNITQDQNGVVVNDLTEIQVKQVEEALNLIEEGNSRRVVAETKANQFSSRSHAIVVINIQRFTQSQTFIGKFSLVDLAGSEKQTVHEKSQNKNVRTFQGSNINRSLLALGNCINMLSDKKSVSQGQGKNSFIPYRDSKLTRLLKDSLGGNTKTTMIACVSQSILYYEQTINTLKYACRATKIQKMVHQNIKDNRALEKYKKQCENLKKQNNSLKIRLNKISKNSNSKFAMSQGNVQILKCRLLELVQAVQTRCLQNQQNSQQIEQSIIENIINMAIQTQKKARKQSDYEKYRAIKSQSRNQKQPKVNNKQMNIRNVPNVKQVQQQNIQPEYYYRSKPVIPSLQNYRKQNKMFIMETIPEKLSQIQFNQTDNSILDQKLKKNNENRHLVTLQNILRLKADLNKNVNYSQHNIGNNQEYQQGCSNQYVEDQENFSDFQEETSYFSAVNPCKEYSTSSLYEEFRRMKTNNEKY